MFIRDEHSDLLIGFSLQIAPSQGPLRGYNREVWNHLAPHMSRAIRLGYRLETLTHSGASLLPSDHARFTLDRTGRLLNCNSPADQLIASTFVKLDRDKRLHFQNMGLHSRITRSLVGELAGSRRSPLTGQAA